VNVEVVHCNGHVGKVLVPVMVGGGYSSFSLPSPSPALESAKYPFAAG